MSKTTKEPPTNAPPKLAKHQAFEAKTVHRGLLKNAPYNPRVIDKHARKKLKEKLQKAGLVETLVWNRRTGNLVGGHQRISIMDELEGNADYSLTVAAIDVDEKKEKELNVFLNNQSAQGNFDSALVADMIRDGVVDIEQMGFDRVDLEIMLDGQDVSGMFADENDDAKKQITSMKEIHEQQKKSKAAKELKNDPEFFLVFVFADRAQCEQFATATGFDPSQRYLSGNRLATLLEVELKTAPDTRVPRKAKSDAPPQAPTQ